MVGHTILRRTSTHPRGRRREPQTMTVGAFAREVQAAFRSVLEPQRYSTLEATERRVVFASPKRTVRVAVTWDEPSRSSDVRLSLEGEVGGVSQEVSLYEVVAGHCGADRLSKYPAAQAVTVEERITQLTELASLLGSCGAAAMAGERAAFDSALAARRRIGEERSREAKSIYATRCRAYEALSAGRFSDALLLFDSIAGSLTSADRNAIEMARRRQSS
jgi:hypothetical protein